MANRPRGGVRTPPPDKVAHTDAVLAVFGLGPEESAQLRVKEAI